MCRYSKSWLQLEQAWVLSYRRAKFQSQLIHLLNVWRMMKLFKPLWAWVSCLKRGNGNTYLESHCWNFWSLGLCCSVGTLRTNPASKKISTLAISARKSYTYSKGCSIKKDNAFKVPGICQELNTYSFLHTLLSFLIPSLILPPGKEGHIGVAGIAGFLENYQESDRARSLVTCGWETELN